MEKPKNNTRVCRGFLILILLYLNYSRDKYIFYMYIKHCTRDMNNNLIN